MCAHVSARRMPAEQVHTCLNTLDRSWPDEVSVGLAILRHDNKPTQPLEQPPSHNPHHARLATEMGSNPGFTNTHATPRDSQTGLCASLGLTTRDKTN